MSGGVVELPFSTEQVIERMVEMERGFCLLCGKICTMRVGEEKLNIYLYCKECGFQGFIRKENGIRNYGAFMKLMLEVNKSEYNKEDLNGRSN